MSYFYLIVTGSECTPELVAEGLRSSLGAHMQETSGEGRSANGSLEALEFNVSAARTDYASPFLERAGTAIMTDGEFGWVDSPEVREFFLLVQFALDACSAAAVFGNGDIPVIVKAADSSTLRVADKQWGALVVRYLNGFDYAVEEMPVL